MNRLQKKCVMATTGFHLLLLVILFVGPAFFWAREKPDDTPVLDMIPANLVDAASTGVQNAQPPPPAPAVVTPPQPTPPAATKPAPPSPKPVVQPAPTPTPTLTERVEKFFKPEPAKPAPAPTENQAHTPKVNLTPRDAHSAEKPLADVKPRRRLTIPRRFNSALRALRANLSSRHDG